MDDILEIESDEVPKRYRRLKKKEDVLEIENESEEPQVYRRLKKKEERKNKFEDQYEFQKSDDDVYTYTDDESYTSELSENVRKEMGLVSREIALYDALQLLKEGDW